MAVTPRIYRTNIIRDSTVTLTTLDEAAATPGFWIKDQLRSKRYRSNLGYTVAPEFNSAFPFDGTDGKRSCYIASGNYNTPAAYATAVQTAINNAGYHPAAVGNSTSVLRADRTTLDANGLAQTALDLSGNSRTATQGTAGQRPLWVANALATGRPAWYFNGTNQSLQYTVNLSTLLGANGVGTIVIVFALDSDASANDALFWAASGADVVDIMWTGTTNFRARGTDAVGVKTSTKTATNGVSAIGVAIWRYDGTNLQAGAFNSAAANFSAITAMAAVKASVLGVAASLGSNGTDHFKGYIFEVQTYSASLTNTDRLAKALVQRYTGMVEGASAPVWGDVWGVTYDSTTKKFSFSHTSGAGTITVPGATRISWIYDEDFNERAHPDLAFNTNLVGVTSGTADTVSYQSRHWIKAYVGTSFGAAQMTACILLDHNVSALGTVTLKNSAIDLFNALSGVGSQAISTASADAASMFATFAGVANNYWRIEISDVQNSSAYGEVGVWYLGTIISLNRGYSSDFAINYDDFSQVSYASFGALHLDERTQRSVWVPTWDLAKSADYNSIVAFRQTTPIGRAFFFAFDSTGDPTNLKYVELVAPIAIQHIANSKDLYRFSMPIREALG